MSYICRACSEIYNNFLDVTDGCPKQRCGGEPDDLIWVDDAFAAVVAEFNKKGLEVYDVDLGAPLNVVSDAPSITFCSFLLDEFTEDEFKHDIFAGLPGDWQFKVKKDDIHGSDKYPVIECVYYGGTNIERQIKFFGNYLALAKFAANMDELNY